MKKRLFGLAIGFLALSIPLQGQQIGLQAGWNSSEIHLEDSELWTDGIKSRSGFHVGLMAEFFKPRLISLRTGLRFTQKGYTYQYPEPIVEFTREEVDLYYLEIPLQVNVNLDIGPEVYIFGGVGPYVSLGVAGKTRATFEVLGEVATEEVSVEWEKELNRLDYGITMDAGLRLWMVDLGVGFDLGLANPDAQELSDYRHRVWRTYFCYWF
jgi:hypothetical protein